jgi:muconolactone D-isomerase
MQFLVEIKIAIPPGMPEGQRRELLAAESARGRELIAAGTLRGIWRIPGRLANWSLYDVENTDELHALLASLPLFPWLRARVIPLATHPLGTVDATVRGAN